MYANDADHWIQKVTTIMCMCMRIYIIIYIQKLYELRIAVINITMLMRCCK
jgi:hypothetical protein